MSDAAKAVESLNVGVGLSILNVGGDSMCQCHVNSGMMDVRVGLSILNHEDAGDLH